MEWDRGYIFFWFGSHSIPSLKNDFFKNVVVKAAGFDRGLLTNGCASQLYKRNVIVPLEKALYGTSKPGCTA